MTKQAKREYITAVRSRYRAASKQEQSSMLDEMVKVTKFNRKYLIRVLNTPPAPVYPISVVSLTRLEQKRRGAPRQYHAPEITQFLCHLWHATNQACAKRLQSLLPPWLPWYEQATGLVLSLEHQVLLTRMAHTTIDRLLAAERSKYRVGKGRCTTKPGTLLKQHIPIKTEQWGEERPGFLEIDTVARSAAPPSPACSCIPWIRSIWAQRGPKSGQRGERAKWASKWH